MAVSPDAIAEIDAQIRADAMDLARRWLGAGYRLDELPTLMRPWLEAVSVVRARALARLERLECPTIH